ncbi:ABC transporter substrate-binding protein [Calidifontibacter sp. DB0510]|uniref:ABC transporter substrate-binding protein n=1 Tax=Metallococcus carri TaxID=1656884 RepID=A0A967B0Y4_9MICO|nr:ABC transporter substrate-binding protein [Metallococcus carri]NHN56004.1 ABC transporter substrate-binding protein [Metallococcus carri]NOP37539.1 ABC transporter substrate-binding protein [Calidifontibacter sp. DB2511S]
MKRLLTTIVAAGLAMPAFVACGGSSSGGGGGSTLVVDDQFDLKSVDPAREFEFTGNLITHQLYETALTFKGSDVKKPVPGICDYTMSFDNKVLTLKVTGKHTFSDGSPVTADDIVFSYQRVQGIAGNPSFLLDGVTVKKVDDKTVTLTSKDPNPQLPFILPNPSLGIVNSKVLQKNGGSTTAKDSAEQFLNKNSQGSGPYMIDTYDVQNKVVLKANPKYAGTKPAYDRIVIQNVQASSQKVNIQGGKTQMALSLGPDQVKGLDASKTQTIKGASTTTIYLWFNMTPAYGKAASNVKFVQAMRHAVDYNALLKLAGDGSVQPGGMVPVTFLGALKSDPNNSYDPAKARQLLAQSGYKGEPISILYSNDVGFGLDDQAQAIQAQVKKVGINLKLNPQPSATSLDAFRSGKSQAGLAYWGADFPDPADYLVFAPGQSLAKRAAWTAAQAPTSTQLATAAGQASGDQARDAAYQKLQQQLNVEGPWIPLFQPVDLLVAATSVKGVALNPLWTVDFGSLTK